MNLMIRLEDKIKIFWKKKKNTQGGSSRIIKTGLSKYQKKILPTTIRMYEDLLITGCN